MAPTWSQAIIGSNDDLFSLKSPLVLMMTWHLLGAKPLSGAVMTYFQKQVSIGSCDDMAPTWSQAIIGSNDDKFQILVLVIVLCVCTLLSFACTYLNSDNIWVQETCVFVFYSSSVVCVSLSDKPLHKTVPVNLIDIMQYTRHNWIWVNIGSDNGLSPLWCQVITWCNADLIRQSYSMYVIENIQTKKSIYRQVYLYWHKKTYLSWHKIYCVIHAI